MQLQKLTPKYCDKTTSYHVRIRTFKAADSGVNICMINRQNECVLRRIEPPIDKGIQQIMFDAPDIGDVSVMLAAPDSGAWGLSDIEVWSGLTMENMQRFTFNSMIGARRSELAAVMTPSVILTPEHKLRYDEEYKILKETMMLGTVQTAIVGTMLTGVFLGVDKAFAYATGGGFALFYLAMLQYEVDVLGKRRNVSFSVVRMAILFGLSAATISQYHEQIKEDDSYFILALIGFMSFKTSILRLIKFE